MKRKKSKRRNSQPTTVPPLVPVIQVAYDVASLNARDRAIRRRMGVLENEHGKLDEELTALQLKRVELRREFDSAANAS